MSLGLRKQTLARISHSKMRNALARAVVQMSKLICTTGVVFSQRFRQIDKTTRLKKMKRITPS